MLNKGLLAAIAAVVLGTASVASACDITGKVVCAANGAGIGGALVSFDVGWTAPVTVETAADGSFTTHVSYVNSSYAVTIDLTNLGGGVVTETAVQCLPNEWGVGLPIGPLEYAVTVPGCETERSADCSPGFYKNHPETWCDVCFAGQSCDLLVDALSARGAGSAEIRDAAKAEIDACFGTAEASPCVDDDL